MKTCNRLALPFAALLAACSAAQTPTDPGKSATLSWAGTWNFTMSGSAYPDGSCGGTGQIDLSDTLSSGVLPGTASQAGRCWREFGNRSYSLSLAGQGKAWVTEADSTITFSAGPCNYQGQLPEAPSPTMSGYGSCRVPTSTGLVEVYWSATRR